MSLNESPRRNYSYLPGYYLNDTASTKAKKTEIKQAQTIKDIPKEICTQSVQRNNSYRKKTNLSSSSTISLPSKERNNAKTKPEVSQNSTNKNPSVFERLTRPSRRF